NFVVGDGRLEERVPVDEPLAAENEAVLEELEERPAYGPRADIIEREPRSPPVAACAELPELIENAGLVFVPPFPDTRNERFAADVMPGLPLFLEHPALDNGLRGDSGMVGPGHPERLVSLHPPPAGDEVLERPVESVS